MDRILIVEDEEPISELIKMNLKISNYNTFQAYDGEEALNFINNQSIDLVLLDIMIPKIDGLTLLPMIRRKGVPVILLTAKNSLNDKVNGLENGAEDYITKPFEALELLARINVVLRRNKKDSIDNKKTFDGIDVFLDKREVTKNGVKIELTPREFDLLSILIQNKGIALTRDRLLELAWGYDYEGGTRTVDMHIQRIRTKLGTDKIKTVFKIGYRLED